MSFSDSGRVIAHEVLWWNNVLLFLQRGLFGTFNKSILAFTHNTESLMLDCDFKEQIIGIIV
ncbi:MAG: hypothetical protein ACJAUL_002078 [Paraglaciecola sp.]|jgi:hypothetical protein